MSQDEEKDTPYLADDILDVSSMLDRIEELEETIRDLRKVNESLIDRMVGMVE